MATIKKATKNAKAKPAVAAKKTAAAKAAAVKTAAKKPAAKAAAAKTATAKKAAVKKPAAKKTAAVKTSAVKTATAKKAAVKKPAAKKTAAVKTVAKKPAAKAASAKTASTKTAAVKTTAVAKPAKTNTALKTAPVVKTTAKTAPAAKSAGMGNSNTKFLDLFEAYMTEKLPLAQGYIVSSFFSDTSAYSIYEVVTYAGVKEIFLTDQGLQFITGGKKLYILVEPASYHNKPQEPVHRTQGESIPKRFSELDIMTAAANQTKIMIAKEPDEIYGSFTILKPSSINFSVVFYQLPDVYQSLEKFFLESLNRFRHVPQADAKKAAKLISDVLQKSMGFQSDYA